MTDTITIDRGIIALAHDALVDAICIVPPNHPDYQAMKKASETLRRAMYSDAR